MQTQPEQISTAAGWRAAASARRLSRAEALRLPSGATILAVRPDPLEWIMAGRIPQRLLAAALSGNGDGPPAPEREMTREEVLEVAQFAARLVAASIVEPVIGEAPDEISLDEIPLEDRAFIFQWACRALRQSTSPQEADSRPSTDGLERFCAK